MLTIKKMSGFAGLRLKDDRPLEIKKGINLIVGRNGSGKSNLASLVKFIFNQNYKPEKKLFESPFLEEIRHRIEEKMKPKIEAIGENINALQVYVQEFGEYEFCSYSFGDIDSTLKLMTDEEIEYISLVNIMQHDLFQGGGFLVVASDATHLSITEVIPKIELNYEEVLINGNFNLFKSSNQNSTNPIVQSIVDNFNAYFRNRLKKFLENDEELLKMLKHLQTGLLNEYNNFFEPTDKKIHLTLNPNENSNRALFLKDGDYIIGFESLSDGEKNLFNLIINLTTARTTKPDLILFDEPELFMHDDMIRTLAKEIKKLSADLPDTTILLSTHSGVLIEEIANAGKESVNLVAINDKRIFNSNEDIDFINALSHNGVQFSPLYLSKRPHIFIENNSRSGEIHRKFLLSFFEPNKMPNIIAIGSSSQVKNYDTYFKTIENIMSTQANANSIGILDGDMLLVQEFKKLFDGDLSVNDLIKALTSLDAVLIQTDVIKDKKLYYFNYWEIENLYFVEETIPLWKSKQDAVSLDYKKLLQIVHDNKNAIVKSWLKTYWHFLFTPVYFRNQNNNYAEMLKGKISDFEAFEAKAPEHSEKLECFFDKIVETKLFNWLPGKEINSWLQDRYSFDASANLKALNIARQIQSILD